MLTARYPAAARYRRVLVPCGSRHVHARVAGRGPVVVALHESPRSSLSLLPVLDALAERHTVIALDTPGYGESDPLPLAEPTMADYVRAVVDVLDALGLDRVGLYGAHTGAAIAASVALAVPQRVSTLVLDGFAAFTPTEQRDFTERYLAPFEPSRDGTHLAALWSRVRDLYMWFPWHHHDADHRLQTELPSVAALYGTVRGFLAAGAGYGRGYRCAGTFDAAGAVTALSVPTLVTAQPHDLIASHLGRLPQASGVAIRALPPGAAAWAQALREHFAAADAAPAPRWPLPGERRLINVGDGALHLRYIGGVGRPRVLFANLPLGVRSTPLAAWCEDGRPLIAIDPPGCALSDPLARDAASATLSDWLQPVSAALTELGCDAFDVVGLGRGAVLARALAEHDARAGAVEVDQPPDWDARPALTPRAPLLLAPQCDPDGGSLLATWFRLRDLQWYEDISDGLPRRRRRAAQEDLAALYDAHRDLWLGPQAARLVALLQEVWRTRA
jgi:pimeloyl-ACP methyl ester carboxylesterase